MTLVTEGIIRMPYKLAMASDWSRLQFYNAAQGLLDQLQTIESKPETKTDNELTLKALAYWATEHWLTNLYKLKDLPDNMFKQAALHHKARAVVIADRIMNGELWRDEL